MIPLIRILITQLLLGVNEFDYYLSGNLAEMLLLVVLVVIVSFFIKKITTLVLTFRRSTPAKVKLKYQEH